MNRKTHILDSKKITEAHNPKRSSKFVRGYGVLHSMLRNLMSLCIKIFPHITLSIFCHSVPHITSEFGGWGGNLALSPDLIEDLTCASYFKIVRVTVLLSCDPDFVITTLPTVLWRFCYDLRWCVLTLKRKWHHFDEIFANGFIGSCYFENIRCRRWQNFVRHFHFDEGVSREFILSGDCNSP